MGLLIGLGFWVAFVHQAFAADWHVDDSNLTSVQDGSARRPFRSIQSAISAAAAGDTVRVALGTYGPITTLGKPLTLRGGYPGQTSAGYAGGLVGDFSAQGPAPSATVIDGGGSTTVDGVTFTRFSDAPYQVTLDNFTVRRNRKGIVCDTEVSYPHATRVTLTRNLVEDNGASLAADQEGTLGGGVVVTGSDGDETLVQDNVIRRNHGGRGAGVAWRGDGAARLRITGNRIEDNVMQADHGGAVYVFGDVILEGNSITGNRQVFGYGWGGGVLMFNVGTLRSSGNVIARNHAVSQGGGIFVDDGAAAVLQNDLIHHNTTDSGQAGAILVDDGVAGDVPVSSRIQLLNCTVAFNNAGVPPADPFNAPGGNGIYLDGRNALSSAAVTNCVFWGNGDDFYAEEGHSSLAVVRSLSAEAIAGTGNITGRDPLFTDPAAGDFSLRTGSPCIDAGDTLPWTGIAGATDFAGHPRVANGTVDLGALELVVPLTPYSLWIAGFGLGGDDALPAADPDHDGVSNLSEFAFGTSPTAGGNQAPLAPGLAGGRFVVSFLQRTDGSLAYTVQHAESLSTAFADNPSVTASITNGPSSPAPPAGYVRRQFSVPATGTGFFRVRAAN